MEVLPQGGNLIKSLVEAGDYLQVVDSGRGKNLAFKPDVGSKPAKVQALEIKTDSNGKETQTLLDEVQIEVGPNTPLTKIAEHYSVRITEVLTRP